MLRTSRPSAFTLIEVLLALSLSTLLIGSVYWALAAGFDAHRRAERALRSPLAVELVLETLRTDLRGAVRPGGWLAAEFVSSDDSMMRGTTTHTLTFYTTSGALDADRSAGVRRVTWSLAEPTDATTAERAVVVRRVTDNLLAPDEAEADQQVMATEAMNLAFRFHDGEQWQTDWDSTERNNALPVAVEVTLALHDPPAREPARAAADDEWVYELTRVLAVPAAQLEETLEQSGTGGDS